MKYLMVAWMLVCWAMAYQLYESLNETAIQIEKVKWLEQRVKERNELLEACPVIE